MPSEFFDSSDSVSSLKTYVEEMAQSVSSGKVEVMGGRVDRRPEEEMEGGEVLSANRTKWLYSKIPVINRIDV